MSEARARDDDDLRTIALIAYGLFVFAIFNGVTAIAGVVLAYIKRDASRGTIWEGHFRSLWAASHSRSSLPMAIRRLNLLGG